MRYSVTTIVNPGDSRHRIIGQQTIGPSGDAKTILLSGKPLEDFVAKSSHSHQSFSDPHQLREFLVRKMVRMSPRHAQHRRVSGTPMGASFPPWIRLWCISVNRVDLVDAKSVDLAVGHLANPLRSKWADSVLPF